MSGFISDRLGRKVSLASAFIPMALGLYLLYALPQWPIFPIAYGSINLGWGVVLIVARAIPADIIIAESRDDSIRVFAMVLVPTFLFDGSGPLLGSYILNSGGTPLTLYLVAMFITLVALVASLTLVSESLSTRSRQEARSEGVRSFARLGRPFWLLVIGTIGFIFIMRMTMPYFGNLCVGEWGVDETVYAISWSAYSFTSAFLSYSISGLADKNRTLSYLIAIMGNVVVLGLLAVGSGSLMLFFVNVFWAAPLVVWLAAETSLIVEGLPEHRHGSALGTYRVVMMIAGLAAANVGAYIWEVTGSLRVLYGIGTVTALFWVVILAIVLRVRSRYIASYP